MSVHKDKRKKLSVRSNHTELMLDFTFKKNIAFKQQKWLTEEHSSKVRF